MVKIRQNHPNIRLRDLRRQREWTQSDVAQKLGVTDLTVGRWERGEAVPFPYYQQKLCDLFGKTREELGLTSIHAHGEDKTQDDQKCDKLEEKLDPAPILLPDAELPQMASNEKKHDGKFRPLAPKFVVLFVGLGLVLIAGTIGIFFNWGGTTTSSVLYHTDWSNGPDQWPVSTNLRWSKEQGGVLESDYNISNSIIFAPYTGSTSSYTVEAQVQRVGYSDSGGQAYGLAIETTPNDGYVCGVGIHYLPEHFFIAHSHLTASIYWLNDLADQPASLDHSWHTYRMEVRKNAITFSVDGKVIQSVDIPMSIQTGRVGLYVDNAAIIIKSFRVLALP